MLWIGDSIAHFWHQPFGYQASSFQQDSDLKQWIGQLTQLSFLAPSPQGNKVSFGPREGRRGDF